LQLPDVGFAGKVKPEAARLSRERTAVESNAFADNVGSREIGSATSDG
jgi:hypothetical protein